jgi:DNA repair exonuclease SbcCD ATPase subunit
MSDVLELGHRITVALDRIRRGMEAQDKADAAESSLFDALRAEQAQTGALRDQIQQLQAALETQDAQAAQAALDAQAAQAALDAQVADQAALHAKDAQVAALTVRLETQAAQLQTMDAHLQGLRAATQQLRDLNGQLRQALTVGLAPGMIDTALAAEIDALQALRATDAAEIDMILAELTPLIEDAAHAAG